VNGWRHAPVALPPVRLGVSQSRSGAEAKRKIPASISDREWDTQLPFRLYSPILIFSIISYNLCGIALTSLLCSLDWLHPHTFVFMFNLLRYFIKINNRPGLCTSKATFDRRVSCQKFGEKALANFGLPVASGSARSRLLPLNNIRYHQKAKWN